jgi:uncharacterized membrane protein YhhN
MKARLQAFIIMAFLHLFAQLLHAELLIQITKPLLMPLLLYYYLPSKWVLPLSVFQKRMIAALVLAWAGDTVLLFSEHNELYFILGIVCFLFMQGMYIMMCFYLIRFKQLSKYFMAACALVFVIYGVSLLLYLLPSLGNFTIPVLIYASALTLTGIASSLTKQKLSKSNYVMLVSGTALFILSDSILAINRFQTEIAYAGFLIMATYLAAQFLIVKVFKNLELKQEIN